MKGPENEGERALEVVNVAKVLIIKNNEDLEEANAVYEKLFQMSKNIKNAYQKIIDTNREAWKTALAERARFYDPVKEQVDILKAKIVDYKTEAERERKNKEAVLYEEAVKQEEERRLQEAEANPKQADDILSEPVSVAPVVVPKDLPKGGPVLRTVWGFEVVDIDELIKAVYEGKIANIALLPNDKFLGEQARSFKEHLMIPGVRSFSRMV